MKLKGELDSIGVTELFKTLADQRATGVLAVVSPMGEKTIALSHGEIAVCADNLSERTRLGDLLVARGKLTDEQLVHALKAQRLDPRSKLGDVLVKQGLVTTELIAEAIRFQVEEQIIDLFTWKEATFEFDSDKNVDDVYDPDGTGNPVQRLSVNTQPMLAEAAKRNDTWKQIQQRIPTPYLCFKLAPKGEELVTKAPRATQMIVKLLKEGRTLETTIKKSCLGRFNVCTTVMKMLDDAWIFPIPGNELRFLASEHRFKKRFLDALYIYRRLLDTSTVESEQAELRKQIQDTIDAIHAAAASGDTPEGSEVVSFKEAAERYKRRQKVRRIALIVFGFAAVFLVVFMLLQKIAPKAAISEDYQKAIKASDKFVDEKNFDAAIKLWHDFYNSIPDKGSDTANFVRERESTIIKKLDSYIESQMVTARNAEKAKNYDEAIKIYESVATGFPTSSQVPLAQEGIDRVKQARKTDDEAKAHAAQVSRAKAALALLDQKQFVAARKALEEVLKELSDGSELRPEIEAGLKLLQDRDDRAQQALSSAKNEVLAKHGERAIEAYDQVIKEGPDAPGYDTAKKERQSLQLNLEKLQSELKRGRKQADAEGGVVAALEILRRAEGDYPDFELTRELRKEIEALNGKLGDLNKLLTEAQDALKSDRVRGMELYKDLLRKEFAFLAVKNVKIPIKISSTPSGSVVIMDGKEVGKTPLEVDIPVSGAAVLRVEHDGYEPYEQRFNRLMPDELNERHTTLKRKPLAVIELGGPIFAPPRLIDGSLFVLHGTSLTVLDPLGKEVKSTLKNLFSDQAPNRPNPDGVGMPILVEKNWWYPRTPPEPFKAGKAFLIFRTRDVLSLDLVTLKTEKLASLPTAPVGKPYLETASYLAGKPLLAVGCEDGLIYIIDLETGKMLEKGSPVSSDPRKERKTSLATGLVSFSPGSFVSLSSSGWLRCSKIHDGTLIWELDLKGEVGPDNFLPSGSETIAPIVMKDGRVVVVDVKDHQLLWEIPAVPTEEASHAVVAADGIYVLTRRGVLKKFDRAPMSGQAKSIWSHPLDGDSKIPFLVGSAIFVATDAGTIWSLSPTAGKNLWQYRTEEEVTQISVIGDLLYVTTTAGRLLILKTGE